MNAALALATNLTAQVSLLAKDKPVDEDTNIVAGWLGFAVFATLIVAVAVIGFALSRSLKTAQRAKDSGVYGPDDTTEATDTTDTTGGTDASAGSADAGGSAD